MTKKSATKKPAAKSIDSKPAATNHEAIGAASTKGAPETIATAPTKADKARAIFAESYAMSPVPARKDILARARTEAGLTDAGAATYLQNYRRDNNLTGTKPAATAAPSA